MKWTDKGHQFDEIAGKFAEITPQTEIFIYGAADLGSRVYNMIRFLNLPIRFVDANVQKQKDGFLGHEVISPQKLFSLPKNHIVIVSAFGTNAQIISKSLLINGYIESQNFFTYDRFENFYFPIYCMYVHNKLFYPDITIIVTEKCTLRCKNCAPMYPYFPSPKNISLDSLKSDIDLLFNKVDYVNNFILTGGEPFLNHSLFDTITYLYENYSHRFNCLQIISNGTVIPSENLLLLLHKMNAFITVSNYTKNIPALTNKFYDFITALDKYFVKYSILEVENWSDFGFAYVNNSEASENEMISFFDRCCSPCRAFGNGKFIFCVPAYYSEYVTQKCIPDENNFFISDSKKELLEFGFGYSTKGYLNMCRKCNGYMTINHVHVEPGNQLEI